MVNCIFHLFSPFLCFHPFCSFSSLFSKFVHRPADRELSCSCSCSVRCSDEWVTQRRQIEYHYPARSGGGTVRLRQAWALLLIFDRSIRLFSLVLSLTFPVANRIHSWTVESSRVPIVESGIESLGLSVPSVCLSWSRSVCCVERVGRRINSTRHVDAIRNQVRRHVTDTQTGRCTATPIRWRQTGSVFSVTDTAVIVLLSFVSDSNRLHKECLAAIYANKETDELPR